jgi:hypothetical protein
MADTTAIRERAQAVLQRHRWSALRGSFVPITAHVGSLVTIFSAWFMRSGQFNFRTDSVLDWLVAGILAFIGYSGYRVIQASVGSPHTMSVQRSELVDLIAAARLDADTSVVNFAGDLSWLREDVDISKSLRSENSAVKMEIFYDKGRTSPSLSPLLDEYRKMRIDLIPYPDGIDPLLRCTLIDRENPNTRKMFVYTRSSTANLGGQRDKQLFTWKQVGVDGGYGIDATIDLIGALKANPRMPILIGVSGANNVGKTSIIGRVRALIGHEYDLRVIDDEFRVAARASTKDDAYSTLCSQLVRLQSVGGDICIVDRTIADNLCFLRLRSADKDDSYAILAPRIAELIKSFHLTFDVKRSVETYEDRTRYLSGPERKKVREYLDAFFTDFGITITPLWTDSNKLEDSIEEAANTIAEAAKDTHRIYRTGFRRTS